MNNPIYHELHKAHFRPMFHLERLNSSGGGHYFDADTKRFFKSRIKDEAYAHASGDTNKGYFIDSIRMNMQTPREYKVKEFEKIYEDGKDYPTRLRIDTVETFGSMKAAIKHIVSLQSATQTA